jgi:hypothetical protein
MDAMATKAVEGFIFRKRTTPQFFGQDKELILEIPLGLQMHKLYAGSAMIEYCEHCGWPSDIKHEEYFLAKPAKVCGECRELDRLGLLAKAKQYEQHSRQHPLEAGSQPTS